MPTRRPLTRRDVDVRLGYTGLGVGALTFVLVLVASFVVIEVAPRVDLPDVLARQSVVRYPALQAVVRVEESPTGATAADPDRPAQDPGEDVPEPDRPDASEGLGGGDEGDLPDDDGSGPPGDPGSPAAEGPVSQALDPAVDGLTDALDSATGGASSPVTGPAGGLTDDVTDLGDAILGQP